MREDHIMTSETQNTVIKNMASDGCYFLAICELGERIAHRPVDAIEPTNCIYYIEKWHNNRTGFDHFRLHDWDSLKNSVTVREGYIEDYRVFEEAD